MKLNTLILTLLIFTSCTQTPSVFETQEVKIVNSTVDVELPDIEKNSSDVNFKLTNGVLYYNDNFFSGIVNEFYENGNLKTKSHYFKGRRQGYFNGWHTTGNKWFERTYNNGLKTGIHVGWYDSKIQKFEYFFDDKGNYNGSVKEWHSNETLAKHFNFIDGKESGSQKMWKPNGNIRANFFTVNGERHGLIGLKNCVSIMSDTEK